MKRGILSVLVMAVAALALCATASAKAKDPGVQYPGIEHLSYAAGPFNIVPGANQILIDSDKIPKPTVDGYMTMMQPNLKYALPNGKCCGAVPLTNMIHLHHGVWLSDGIAGRGEGNTYGPFYPFMASGEEKTIYTLPRGYGYPVGARDAWILNYMIHNLTPRATRVYITYRVDFLPADTPAAVNMKAAHPIWMDVQDHHIYPVFNVMKGSGRNGKFTYPDMAKDPYGNGPPLNVFTVDHAGTLLGTAGHLHPGGLYDTLYMSRAGAHASHGAIAGPYPNSVRLFRSNADYFDHLPPISWNMAMTASAPNWRVQVQPGDQLRITSTYETKLASWYEVMGIMIVWEAWGDQTGINPFNHKLNQAGHITHGQYPENRVRGGTASLGEDATGSSGYSNVSLKSFSSCRTNKVVIAGFSYNPGDFAATGRNRCIPTIKKGQSLEFINADAQPGATGGAFSLSPDPAYLDSVFHSISSCKYPCNLSTGIAYPIENGATQFDSGQLGAALPAVGRLNWSTPANLPPGTYTFFCRIHPWMRGVFRIVG